MTLKAIKSVSGVTIPLNTIERAFVTREECTGDGEYDDMNTWQLEVEVARGKTHIVFEAEDYDNPKQWFGFADAVKGKNHDVVQQKLRRLERLVAKESPQYELITL